MLGVTGQPKNISKRGDLKLPSIKTRGKKNGTVPTSDIPRKKCDKIERLDIQPILAVDKVLSVLEIANSRLGLPAGAIGDTGSAVVRFNHYNKSFPIHNGVLKWADVDEIYCLSFVYKGNYRRDLYLTASAASTKVYAVHDDEWNYFIDMRANSEYSLEVTEDPIAGVGAEGLRISAAPLKAGKLQQLQQSSSSSSKLSALPPGASKTPATAAVDCLTAELKAIDVSQLNNERARDLIERRDIEDILYSSG